LVISQEIFNFKSKLESMPITKQFEVKNFMVEYKHWLDSLENVIQKMEELQEFLNTRPDIAKMYNDMYEARDEVAVAHQDRYSELQIKIRKYFCQ